MADLVRPDACDVGTTTHQPRSKHVHTYEPKRKDATAVAKDTWNKSSQTCTKKEIKELTEVIW